MDLSNEKWWLTNTLHKIHTDDSKNYFNKNCLSLFGWPKIWITDVTIKWVSNIKIITESGGSPLCRWYMQLKVTCTMLHTYCTRQSVLSRPMQFDNMYNIPPPLWTRSDVRFLTSSSIVISSQSKTSVLACTLSIWMYVFLLPPFSPTHNPTQ